ncbi:pyridoxamine 5'-phosphate oxidase family protein [Nocardia sp. BMG51109]|uniref:pyridoxamine 5'-phosphate oxidase family protein n=1 Tax=Nocardia sp. BMG51109 TaxID=1056816 RepID=UPI000467830A|nr:pyridoxamine 5'-phosphate oxidase family protein [Nocardia sp. BMG51109]
MPRRHINNHSPRAGERTTVPPTPITDLAGARATRRTTTEATHKTVAARDIAPDEALRLLASVNFGRIVFSRHALPTIRPANHAVVDGSVITDAPLATSMTPHRQVVAYEADIIDHTTHLGWCVIVTGPTDEITDPHQRERYRALLNPGLPGPRDRVITIRPDIVTGIRFIDPDEAATKRPPQ